VWPHESCGMSFRVVAVLIALIGLKGGHDGRWKTVYFWPTWAGEEERISEPLVPGKLNADYPIAFVWDGSFKLRIPDLAPGVYRITKRFTSGPKGREDTTLEVEIEVVS